MRQAASVAMALLAAALAGCAGGKDAGREGEVGDDPRDADGAALPQWGIRDWWTFETTSGSSTYVVTADQGADWFMDITDPDTAFRDARMDISRLGAIRKSDLAGSRGDERVQFFQWPLHDNKTWKTLWDGEELTVTARVTGVGNFEFVARSPAADVYRYTYDADVGWFRDFQFLNPDGSPRFSLTLTDSGQNFTGEVARWHLETIYGASTPAGSFGNADTFEVPAGATDLWLSYDLECTGSAGYLFAFQPTNPPGPGYQANGQCTSNHFAGAVVASPAPGTWTYAASFGSGQGSALMLQRTLVLVPVP